MEDTGDNSTDMPEDTEAEDENTSSDAVKTELINESKKEILCDVTYMESDTSEDEKELLNMYSIGEFLFSENMSYVDDEAYSYYMTEIEVVGVEENGDDFGFDAESFRFSNMSMAGEYWEENRNSNYEYSDSKLNVKNSKSTTSYVNCKREKFHDVSYAKDQLLAAYGEIIDLESGVWEYKTGSEVRYLIITDDGRMISLKKTEGVPIEIYVGAYTLYGEDRVKIIFERLGYGNMPFEEDVILNQISGNLTILGNIDATTVVFDDALDYVKSDIQVFGF